MELIFTDQYANILLLVNGLAILFFLAAKKKNRKRAMKFGNYETLQKVAGRKFLKSSSIVIILRLAAFTALIIGVSNPVLVEEVPSPQSDYVLAIDSSTSMLAEDLEPDRFEASKDISAGFVSRISGESSVGVVSFAGEVNKEVGLSEEKSNVSSVIREMKIGDTAGTAIGDALITSSSMLIDNNRSAKIILITDGRNNVGSSINESLSFLEGRNMSVNTIGIGSRRNQTEESFGTIEGENASRAQFPNLNEQNLFRISNQTGGELETVTSRGEFESAFVSMEREEVRRDFSRHFIFLAVVLMLSEWALGSTRYSIIP